MSTGNVYLAASGLTAAAVVNAYRPFTRTGSASIPVWTSGWLTSELPLASLGWQAMVTAVAAGQGALRHRPGQAGLALSVASAAGLVGLRRGAVRSAAVLDAALVEGLGPDYRSRIVLPLPADDTGVAARRVRLPAWTARRRYARQRDVPYGEHGRRNQLDIWSRSDLPADRRVPVLIQVHGGAWTMGSKETQALPLMGYLASRGWVCVAINYRLSPHATWPDLIVDVKQAIAWVKAHIDEHGGDPDFVAITGGSAGGHLAALAALTPNDPGYQPGFEDADTSVQAAVPFYGVYDMTNRDQTGRMDTIAFLEKKVFKSSLADQRRQWDEASPMSRVGPHAPPFFVVHGTNDSLVPIEQARAFVGLLRAASTSPVAFAELPYAQHAFETLPSVRTGNTTAAVERFLGVAHGDHQRAAGGTASRPR